MDNAVEERKKDSRKERKKEAISEEEILMKSVDTVKIEWKKGRRESRGKQDVAGKIERR